MPIPQLSKRPQSPQTWRNSPKPTPPSYTRSHNSRQSYGFPRPPRNGGWFSHPLFKKIIGNGVYSVLVFGIIALVLGFGYVVWVSRDLPNPNKLIERDLAESTKIYDRTGEKILYEIHGEEKRTVVQLQDIPEYVKWATITAEDRSFYEHHGFNLLAIFKGVIIDPLMGKRARGGSTLTQQLVKNAILTNERKISRKIREFILSYRIENKFSKDEILQMYLNEIPYGSTAYGIEAAARRYFGISARELNLAQASLLAALPQAPSYYSPYGTHLDRLIARQQWILESMQELGYITEEELQEALAYELEFQEPNTAIVAPHFVMYIREQLSEKYGESVIEREGLKIITTLDLYKQEIAEEVVAQQGEKNMQANGASNAALVSLDPKTGHILAMVGSRDYFNEEIDGQVNVALRPRQPGSSLKPLVYAVAFDKGYTADTVLYDVVTNFALSGTPYEPKNYNLKEHGPVTIRTALAGSLNIPAVKALYLVGVNAVVDQARKMGYTTLTDPDRYGLALVLGGAEVKLLEHTAAYGVFAREGEYHPPVGILRVEDRDGNVLEEYKEEKENVMAAETARMVNDILSDNNARAYAFGAQNWLTLPNRPVAAKTGTTNDYRDAWTIGYTPSLVTGVWAGNNDNSEMNRGDGGSRVAAPIWNEYMRRVLGDTPAEAFRAPKKEVTGKPVLDGSVGGEVKVRIDTVSGLLATEHTPEELIEEKTFKQPHSILYYVKPNDPRGEMPKPEERDPQYEVWEAAVQRWAGVSGVETETPPTEYDNVHKPENIPQVSILSPSAGATITSSSFTPELSLSAPLGIGRTDYSFDGYQVASVTSYPYTAPLNVSVLGNGRHTLGIRVCDIAQNCWNGSVEINVNVKESDRNDSLSLAWDSPRASTVTTAQFPLTLSTLSYNPAAIKEVVFYSMAAGDNTPQRVSKANNVSGNQIQTSWRAAPTPGKYLLYAEATGWSGNFIKTDPVMVTIQEAE